MRQSLITYVSVLAFSLTACLPTTAPQADDVGSGLSDIGVGLPEATYTHYVIEIKRADNFATNNKCSENYRKLNKKEVTTFSHRVKNGCDYIISLELGSSKDEQKLEKVLYTNKVNNSPGTRLPSNKLTGGKVDVPITVYKVGTEAGPGSLQSKETTDIGIDVEFKK